MLKQLLFGGETSASPLTNLGLTLLRIFAGIGLMTHGVGKIQPKPEFIESVAGMGFPMPVFFAWAAGLAEFAGGALLILGLFTRPVSFLIAFTMGTALLGRHLNDPFATQEKAFLYFFIALAFLFMGANFWSVDGILRRNRSL
ncbi:MAG TPA: DoxX family protein [Pyrinomonadaceae bacterium]|nr:DoxX family protein [Pyrinomonadaceae bacterium]